MDKENNLKTIDDGIPTTYKGTPQTGKQIVYVSPDMLEHTMATLFLERYRPMLIPKETKNEKINYIRKGLMKIIDAYDSGDIKEINLIPAKDISTTDRQYANEKKQNFGPGTIPKFTIDNIVLDFGIHSIEELEKIFDPTLMEQKLYRDNYLID
jgi:hypothetical protein